jgi:transglutaminase-like putative cysteine protease
VIEVDLVAEMAVVNPFDFFLEPSAESFPFSTSRRSPRTSSRSGAARRRAHAPARVPPVGGPLPRRTIDALVDLNRRLAAEVAYVIRMEPGVQTPEETLELRRGSCRDSAWLLVQVLRHLARGPASCPATSCSSSPT